MLIVIEGFSSTWYTSPSPRTRAVNEVQAKVPRAHQANQDSNQAATECYQASVDSAILVLVASGLGVLECCFFQSLVRTAACFPRTRAHAAGVAIQVCCASVYLVGCVTLPCAVRGLDYPWSFAITRFGGAALLYSRSMVFRKLMRHIEYCMQTPVAPE